MEIYQYREFESERVPKTMQYPGSSILVPRKVADAVIALQGGFDQKAPGMEDWDYQIAVHHLGFCAYHVPEPLFVYRMHTSTKREADYAKIDEIRAYADTKWGTYRKGETIMSCGCGGKKKVTTKPTSTLQSSGNFAATPEVNAGEQASTMVTVEYVGPTTGPFSVASKFQNGLIYRFGSDQGHKQRSVLLGDAIRLTGLRNGEGHQLYVMLANTAMNSQRDPAAFLGQAVS
jgi:hypothetical protein